MTTRRRNTRARALRRVIYAGAAALVAAGVAALVLHAEPVNTYGDITDCELVYGQHGDDKIMWLLNDHDCAWIRSHRPVCCPYDRPGTEWMRVEWVPYP